MVQDKIFEKKTEIDLQRDFLDIRYAILELKDKLLIKGGITMEAVVTIAIIAFLMVADKIFSNVKSLIERKRAIRKRSCIRMKKSA